MNKDNVTAAFELIIEEIEVIASELAEQGGKAFRDQTYEIAQQLIESGKNLQNFRAKVVALLDDWQSGIDIATRQRFKTHRIRESKPLKAHTKGPKNGLRVSFSGGPKIDEYFAADTFALALRHIGLDRVEALGISKRNMHLIGTSKSEQYGQRLIDGKYILTHSSTQEKKETLEKIAKKLGVNLKVEIV